MVVMVIKVVPGLKVLEVIKVIKAIPGLKVILAHKDQ
jgi:hypothetical protein